MLLRGACLGCYLGGVVWVEWGILGLRGGGGTMERGRGTEEARISPYSGTTEYRVKVGTTTTAALLFESVEPLLLVIEVPAVSDR